MKKLAIILGVVLFPIVLFAQNQGTTTISFLEIPAGARSIGMGEAYVSVADEVSALYWNPAGITRLNTNQASFQYTEWFVDTRLNYAATVVKLKDTYLGVNINMFDGGLMDVTTLTFPDGTGEEFSVQDISLGFTYAQALTENFSIGGTLKLLQSRIWRMRASTAAVDLGFQYQTPFDKVELGFSISNFGSEMKLSGDNTFVRVDLDPQNAGNNDGIPANLLLKSWDLPLIFRIGLNYKALNTLDHKLIIAGDAVYPNNNVNYLNFGAEYGFRKVFFIRGGYSNLFVEDNYGLGHLRGGVGIYVSDRISVDYAYSDRGELGGISTIGASINF